MQFSTSIFVAIGVISSVSALQVNWYSDTNCGNYIDSTFFQGRGIHGNEVNGQPAGAGSALFVTTNGCPVYGCTSTSGGCSTLNTYQCFTGPSGTWVSSRVIN